MMDGGDDVSGIMMSAGRYWGVLFFNCHLSLSSGYSQAALCRNQTASSP